MALEERYTLVILSPYDYLNSFLFNDFLSSFPTESDKRGKSKYLVNLSLKKLFSDSIARISRSPGTRSILSRLKLPGLQNMITSNLDIIS